MSASPATRRVLDALRRHLDGSKWALVEEVNRVDLLAVGCWRSTGYRWHGFEVKVSRSDWRRELAKPGKAQDHLCHAWTVATLPGIVQPGELPAGWGHVVVRSDDSGVTWMRQPAWKRKPLELAGSDYAAIQALAAQAAVARRASYAEADARAMVAHWPGTEEELKTALRVAQKETNRLLPGIGVYGPVGREVAA